MKSLRPGATIGLLGAGQLGRMLALEGAPLGYRFVCWGQAPGEPAAQVCELSLAAPFDDEAARRRFAESCDVATFEWENVPAALAKRLAKDLPVRPAPAILDTVQDRLIQRRFLKEHGFAQTPFADAAAPAAALERLGRPCILKSRRHGYDGKGQFRIEKPGELSKVPALPGGAVLERRVDFKKELSVILARWENGDVATYPVAENVHENGILRATLAPARLPAEIAQAAAALAAAIAEALKHVGVMAVELFWLGGSGKDQLLVNEIAPRVHNSGHYTLGACATSQFEQHIRAIAGLPPGSTSQREPAAMINLLGELWAGGEPRWDVVLARPDVRLHLYGKAQPRPGRKMGHLLLLGPAARDLKEADSLLAALRR
ncbi:MAG: 5-(carboxyamino)imidazole ribonucleotide synthase [Elusimicrobia bacterium]|nr:5-(carboxyamino)imidazole ribonucleotide synthase [Elusimicrobiota bacterium]MDE2236603.1 5-(carboxyamino)imidazole ribonucleotide synthase [Elusimicrobiota bacterium]MDE2425194.1 5-(carboxyamino)imidazole ribonucleotide synthase [Elusimicrobiota bacterium]